MNDFDQKYDIIDAQTPKGAYMSGRYKQSFAYYTLRERLPVILTGILDNLTKNKDELVEKYGEESREEIKMVVGHISKLKYQLQTDKLLEPFTGNEPDQVIWNEFIQQLPNDKRSFFRACWLYSECYMYRKVASYFEATQTLQTHDYFAKQKINAMEISIEVMEAVAKCTRNLERSDDILRRLLKLNLWGNRCDLSLTAGKEIKQSGNPFDLINILNTNVLADETASVWKCLVSVEKANPPPEVDIICDNSGYEFFTDLILAEYLIDSGLASKVRFHVKAIPWFISDVTPRDFHWSLEYLKNHSSPDLSPLGAKWTDYLNEGKFELAPIEYFWTTGYEFYRMCDVNPDLYKRLSDSHLLIFKGDLNYRKLIGDYTWDHSESFRTCLRGFTPTNLCTLRTVKADLICGLRQGQSELLFKENTQWMLTGEYGVIQFIEKEHSNCLLHPVEPKA